MPVVLARLEEDAVAGTDDLDQPPTALAKTDALGDEDVLPVGVRVPGSACAWSEMHARRSHSRGLSWRGDRVNEDGPGEPVIWSLCRLTGTSCDLDVVLLWAQRPTLAWSSAG